MRKILMLLMLSILMLPVTSRATTHLWFWVNGEKSNTLTQGDNFAWELDLSAVGNGVSAEIYLDLNASRTIDSGDYLLDTIQLRDGEQGDGPSDSSAVPNGLIYLQFGPFGFASQNYILRATDEDESTVTNWFEIIAMSDPVATVSGTITVQGTVSPNTIYENVMIGAMGENGMFSGLTDANGDYTINLPVADAQWRISTLFDNTMPGYTMDPREYQMSIPAGNTSSVDFTFILPSSYVYGRMNDQNGALIDRDGWIYLYNQTTGAESESVVRNGYYTVPAQVVIQGSDSTNTFQIRTDDRMFASDYLRPAEKQVELAWGDSLEYNLVAYQTNAKIYGYITENGQNPSKKYQFMAMSDQLGSAITESDATSGYFELSVRQGSSYNVWLQDDPQWGTPPPPGYIIEKNWQFVMPDDTVYFNLIPAHAALAGSISFDPGDPVDLDRERSRIMAWDSTYTNGYSALIDESNNFFIPVPDGKYEVAFSQDNNDYLSMPVRYFNVTVSGDTVDNLNFHLNYAHATLTVKLLGDVPTLNPDFYWINSNPPYVYMAGSQIRPDSTIELRLCEGEWFLQNPIWVNYQEYSVFPSDTTLIVTENDSSYYVEFTYRNLTGISDNIETPVSFNLNQNYPNPFNPATKIEFTLPQSDFVVLKVYDILGEEVATIVNDKLQAGKHTYQFDGSNRASGVYLYRITAGEFNQVKKMILIK